MKKPIPEQSGLALTESLYSFEEVRTDNKLSNPNAISNARRDAKAMAALLETLKGGLSTYIRVYDSLEEKHGKGFQSIFFEGVEKYV